MPNRQIQQHPASLCLSYHKLENKTTRDTEKTGLAIKPTPLQTCVSCRRLQQSLSLYVPGVVPQILVDLERALAPVLSRAEGTTHAEAMSLDLAA